MFTASQVVVVFFAPIEVLSEARCFSYFVGIRFTLEVELQAFTSAIMLAPKFNRKNLWVECEFNLYG